MHYYEFIKAFHLISIIIWFSSSIYLLKTLFFHKSLLKIKDLQLIKKLEQKEIFIYRYVSSLSFVFAVTFGIVLIVQNSALLQSGYWIYTKFFFISLLAIAHHYIRVFMDELFSTELKAFEYLILFIVIVLSIVIFLTITKLF
ncbi:CopD family protein [Halarcobacter sp.]|uniref:CopD family protein n=1 Tax=Halarcobacter sp. TaxID=2321133 RepID=UPI003A92D22F